jgi:hypothetical protein
MLIDVSIVGHSGQYTLYDGGENRIRCHCRHICDTIVQQAIVAVLQEHHVVGLHGFVYCMPRMYPSRRRDDMGKANCIVQII